MRESRRYLTALRRGVALGLALTALWGGSRLVDPAWVRDRLGEGTGLQTALLARCLSATGEEAHALSLQMAALREEELAHQDVRAQLLEWKKELQG